MRILFVCKHNRFRSKVAQAIFEKLRNEKDLKDVSSESAGVLLDMKRLYVEDIVKKIVKEKGYEIKDEKPRQLNLQDLDDVDLIISLGNDFNEEFFCERAKVEFWNVDHVLATQTDKIKVAVDDIEKKVEKLIDNI